MSRSILSDDRLDEIKNEVTFLYEECEVHTYPIDCFAIANKLHFVLRPYSSLTLGDYLDACDESDDGFSRVEQDPMSKMNYYVIYYNDSKPFGRMRWTIFHEIGHIYLGHHDIPDTIKSYRIKEAEADFFAKYAIANPVLCNITECSCPGDIEANFQTSCEASIYLFDYFQKWLRFGPPEYLPFEQRIVVMFKAA